MYEWPISIGKDVISHQEMQIKTQKKYYMPTTRLEWKIGNTSC